jgi:putative membrane protein insertion efficiency factor
VKRSLDVVRGVLTQVVLLPLNLYRGLISPALPRRCKYEPTCSAYAEQAIRKLGLVRGLIVALWRLARCNPWSHGGWDPVEERTIFRPRGAGPADPSPDLGRTPERTVAR